MITLGFSAREDLDRLVAALLTGAGLYPEPDQEELTEWHDLAEKLGEVLDALPDDLSAADPDAPRVVLDDRPTDDVGALLAAVQKIDAPQIRAAAQGLAEVYEPWKHAQEVLRIARAEVAYQEQKLAEARRKLRELEASAAPSRRPASAPNGAKGLGLDPRQVRTWAMQQPDLACPQFGPIPDDVLARYVAVHKIVREGS